jgi:methyl-accepting chemotaxis protein
VLSGEVEALLDLVQRFQMEQGSATGQDRLSRAA